MPGRIAGGAHSSRPSLDGADRRASRPAAGQALAPRLAAILLLLYAAGLLSIGLTRDWRLLHEDNGALHTTFARAHLDLGLGRTHAHNLFFNPTTGDGGVYAHHPPATGLILSAAFAATGSDAPWVARS